MKRYFIAVALLCVLLPVLAQNKQQPCAAPEAAQFDFWVGTWNLYSGDSITGTNTIYKIMGACTVQENFENPKTGYSGKSWSVYNPQSKMWQQTWVDNQGAYIDLSGSFANGRMTLYAAPRKLPDGSEQVFRMRFSNISGNSFDWDWESTTDSGSTWKTGWKIHYVRKPGT